MDSTQTSLEKDNRSVVDLLLAKLSSGQLAERISQSARLAAAEHMLQRAQEMQSAVEAENSAQ